MSILGVAIQNMLAHEDRLIGDTTPVKPHIRAWQKQISDRIAFSRFMLSLELPLTHTAVPSLGSVVPTFTRATTETGQRWDEAGYLDFTALAGEIVWKGARRVRNYFTNTENFASADWTKSNGSFSGNVFTASGAGGSFYQTKAATTGTWLVWAKLSCASGTVAAGLFANGVGVNPNPTTSTITVTTTPTIFQLAITVTSAGNINAGISPYNPIAAGSSVTVHEIQLEDVTGQTTQTASEYVSVGVESAPAYHGSMVDGVKAYDTDRSGNPISTSGSSPLVGYVPWEARTNLSFPSEDDSAAGWTKNACTVAAPSFTAPNGTATASKIVETAANAAHYINKILANSAGVVTFSRRLKKGERDWGWLYIEAAATSVAYFNLNTGVVGTVSGTGTPSATITPLANGWYICTLTATVGANANVGVGVATADNTLSYAGDITKGIYTWGSMAEAGSFATPYIPTTTVAVARNKDEFSETTSGAILAAGGTISLTYIPYHSPVGTIALWGTYVDASNYTAILHDATNLIFRKRIAGVNYDATIANAFTSGTTYKMAASWGAGGSTIYLNGVAGTPHANTTAAQIAATMQFGADGNSLQQPGAAVIKNYIWQRQLSGSEQAAVTA